MTQPNLLELAKQGDAQAIASLMNRQLQPKGITVKVALKDACLQIMLESAQVPNQQALVAFIRKGITGLGAVSIERVKVYGRQTDEEFPAWSQELEIDEQQSVVPNVVTQQNQLSLKERAKQGDIDSITTLLNIALQHKNITAKTSLQDSCLQVMLESDQIPIQTSATVIRREIMILKPESITSVKTYGKQIGNEFPSWTQEFDLLVQKNSNPTVTSQDKKEISNQASTLKSHNLTISVRYFFELLNQKKTYVFLVLVLMGVFLLKIFIVGSHQLEYNKQATKAKESESKMYIDSINRTKQSEAKMYIGAIIKAQQSEAKMYIGSIIRSQQTFYLEKNKFTSTLEDLRVGISSEATNYNYSILSADNLQAISTAAAKEDGLKSYTGAVFLVKDKDGFDTTISTICESNTPSKTPPATPKISGNDIQCSSESLSLYR
jgi:ribosomal protein L35AE/L33A